MNLGRDFLIGIVNENRNTNKYEMWEFCKHDRYKFDTFAVWRRLPE